MTLVRRSACIAGVAAISSLAALQGVSLADATVTAQPAATTVRVAAPAADAYTDATYPHRTTGGMDRLVASDDPGNHKTSYLRFAVPTAPAGTRLTSATLTASPLRTTGGALQLRPVTSVSWSEGALSAAVAPPVGAVQRTASMAGQPATVSFDVTALVAGGATRSFALTAAGGTTVLPSSEAGAGGPRLQVTFSATTPPPPAPGGGHTVFGTSIDPDPHEKVADAVSRVRRTFGGLPVARVYDNGLMPVHWNDSAMLRALGTSSDVIYSFKGDMRAAASGAYDTRLRTFLASRPSGIKVWVALNHEPEDNVERGQFTAAQFRAATAHVAPVIRATGAVPTTILMEYTLTRSSGRDWHDYYTPAVDLLAWDAYNTTDDAGKTTYKPISDIVGPVQAVARETGKPFGWAELGSSCVHTDRTCTGRAAWLTALAGGISASGAQFGAYWDRKGFGTGIDFSLTDPASIRAWSAAMHS